MLTCMINEELLLMVDIRAGGTQKVHFQNNQPDKLDSDLLAPPPPPLHTDE
jgi:hypothetical protein